MRRTTRVPLAGLRVLELGDSPAVSYCGRLLRGFGARVWRLGPVDSVGATETFLHQGKARLQDVYRRDASYHIVIADSPRARTAARVGAEHALWLCLVSGVDAEGPAIARELQWRVGLATPSVPPIAGDAVRYLAATLATAFVLAGLRRSDLESPADLGFGELDLLGWLCAPYWLSKSNQRRAGGFVPCRDGDLWLAFPTDETWRTFAAVILGEALPSASYDTAFDDPITRRIITTWSRRLTRETAAQQTWELGVPAAPAIHPREAVRDHQWRARGFIYHGRDGQRTVAGPVRSRQACWLGDAPALDGLTVQAVGSPPSRGQQQPPFRGVRVLDLGALWAGPQCGAWLACLGADVVKVESPTRSDGTRRGPAAAFAHLNAGKRGLACDLATTEGRTLFSRLLGTADVLLENFSPRVMPNLGFAPESVRRLHPRLLWITMPAFGAHGPCRRGVAYGQGVEAASGMAWLHEGAGERRPVVFDLPLGDPVAAATACLAVAIGLFRRERGHRVGALIEVAQRDALASLIGPALMTLEGVDHETTTWVPAHETTAGPVRVEPSAGTTLQVGGLRLVERRRAPQLGEHSGDVVGEWLDSA